MRTKLAILVVILFLLPACAPVDPQAPTSFPEPATPIPEETVLPHDLPQTATTGPTALAIVTVTPEAVLGATSEPQDLEPVLSPGWVAYTGMDSNIWLVDRVTGEQRQVTQDASPFQPDTGQTTYCCPQWSSDGRLLAFRREVGIPIQSGFEFRSGLMVYDLETGETQVLFPDLNVVGFDWRPGTHEITFAPPIDDRYFLSQPPAPDFASGLWSVDALTGETVELVPPQRGYSLARPQWSPDGRFLAFEEVVGMEGTGLFVIYNLESGEYLAWDRSIGSYTWSPDGERLAYDDLTYVSTGSERVYLNDPGGQAEEIVSPDYESGYAFGPAFSPSGTSLAYFASLSGPGNNVYTLFVQDLPGEDARILGQFAEAWGLEWSPDGSRLIFEAGPYEDRQVLEVPVAGGPAQVLSGGREPEWQPSPGD